VIPRLLRAIYNIRDDLLGGKASNNSQGVAAFNDWYFSDDLCRAHELIGRPMNSEKSYLTGPDIEYFGPPVGAENGESDLDTQYITLMGTGVHTIFDNHADGHWILSWLQETVQNMNSSTGPWVWSISYGWPENGQCDQDVHPFCVASSDKIGLSTSRVVMQSL